MLFGVEHHPRWMCLILLSLAIPSGLLGQTTPGTPPRPSQFISIDDAINLALQHNQNLRAQQLNIDQSKADEITAALKPNPTYTNLNEDFPIFDPSLLTLDNLRTLSLIHI